jgi:hypothetical protein
MTIGRGVNVNHYLLRRYVHLCATDKSAILMDLRHDAYIGLDQAQAGALSKLVRGWPPSNSASSDAGDDKNALAFAEQLVRRHLLTKDDSQGKDCHPLILEPVEASLVDKYSDLAARIRLGDFGKFLMACLRAKLALSCFTLERVVRRMEQRKLRRHDGPGTLDVDRLQALMVKFHYLRSFVYTARGNCLFDSLVVIEFLAAYGVFPVWVIGVNPKPFAAHSWVQQGNLVLNGEPGFVRTFTPIVAV